ncbi:MAG: alcohol dehydrogenase [Acidimicrobiaceae bacterium]|nr:alcohol dehydrogenase [Acidimicrobiaceae bacterium]|tara:strand:+ start:429 stop:1460 length:1032 start_codon:yes stop_codon:yes gene_type:complete
MRAGLVTGKGQFELVEREDPAPNADEVVVAIQRCGICGSDVHAYVEGWKYSPSVCGHEWVGVIAAAGRDVINVKEGDRVTGAIAPGCGACLECRNDLSQYCRTAWSDYAGPTGPTSGGFAPFLGLKAERVIAIPEAIDTDDAALIEPASVAFHAVRKSQLRVGDVVCVVGCGPIGLLTAQVAKAAGAGVVIAVEPDESRRRLALATGSDIAVAPGDELREVLDELTQGLQADLAFDCAGIPQTMQQSVDMVRRGGSVCLVGVTGQEAQINPIRWISKEVTLNSSIVFTLEEMKATSNMIADGRLSVTPLRDVVIDLDSLGSTIDDLAERRIDAVKILVDPTAG